MHYVLSKRFEKEFTKLPKPIKKKVLLVLQKFVNDPYDPSLRNHRLSGKWSNHFSIDVTGDVRAVYVYIKDDVVHFVAVGSHSELYG
ncbi:type II toxin-antitoxin system mRNA interferase toxin, RelE/StbE family [Candidatus Kaiserbacteria bacterium]|nr:type II toxin-antitoxin system mRNA interferase toxin, RelE/StbE family [Candidatus Kaiserbacteria bacterium]MCB9812475.1 type II toxin-antitoxin system mRNA interferase toxin, RelE/StbE family [Candidatus Nomurabacteria bacterium]